MYNSMSRHRRADWTEKYQYGRVQRNFRYYEDDEYEFDSEKNGYDQRISEQFPPPPIVTYVGQKPGMNPQRLSTAIAPYPIPLRPQSSGDALSTEASTASWSMNNWERKPNAMITRSHTFASDIRHRNMLDVHIKYKLGNGAFGSLYFGSRGRDKVAVRKIDFCGRSVYDEFFQKVRTMTKLKHPNLLKVMGTCEVNGRHCLVSAYMKDGSLGRYLRNVKLNDTTRFARQIASGMAYLHKYRLRHGDLRADNVLIDAFNLTVKVADFSLAIFTKQGPRLQWTAPEVEDEDLGYDYLKSDVWSFGILLYEIKEHGKTPRHNIAHMRKPRHWPEKYFSIMKECLHPYHDERPSFTELEAYFERFDSETRRSKIHYF